MDRETYDAIVPGRYTFMQKVRASLFHIKMTLFGKYFYTTEQREQWMRIMSDMRKHKVRE